MPRKRTTPSVPTSPLSTLLSESPDSFRLFAESPSLTTEQTPLVSSIPIVCTSPVKTKRKLTYLYRPATNGGLLKVVRRREFPAATVKSMRNAHLIGESGSIVEEDEEKPLKRTVYLSKFPYQLTRKPLKTLPISRKFPSSLPSSPSKSHLSPFKLPIRIKTESVKPSPAPICIFPRPKRSIPSLELHPQTQKDLCLTSIPRRKSSKNASKSHPKASNSQPIFSEMHSEEGNKAEEEEFDLTTPGGKRTLVRQAKEMLSRGVLKQCFAAERAKMDLELYQVLRLL